MLIFHQKSLREGGDYINTDHVGKSISIFQLPRACQSASKQFELGDMYTDTAWILTDPFGLSPLQFFSVWDLCWCSFFELIAESENCSLKPSLTFKATVNCFFFAALLHVNLYITKSNQSFFYEPFKLYAVHVSVVVLMC